MGTDRDQTTERRRGGYWSLSNHREKEGWVLVAIKPQREGGVGTDRYQTIERRREWVLVVIKS